MGKVYIGITLFLVIFGFISMFSYALLNEFITQFTTAGIYTGQAKAVGDNILETLKLFDYIIVLLLTVFSIGVALTSIKIAVSPGFFVIEVFMVAFYGFISYFFNFIFISLVSDAFFTASKLFFSNTMIIATNLHWVLLANFIIGSIAFFAKREKGQFLQ